MRRLLLTRGPQGSGKSTVLRQLGLEPWAMSADDLRRIYSSPVMGVDGTLGIDQSTNGRAWATLLSVLDERMERGELVVVDATHPRPRDLAPYRRLARKHRYRLAVLDLSTLPLGVVLARNAARPEPVRVPAGVVEATWTACREYAVPSDLHRIPWSEDDAHLAGVDAWLDEPVLDLSRWSEVHHLGDLHGSLTPLLEYLGPDGLRDDAFYCLVGDLCDRGLEDGALLRWVLDHALGRDNVRIHWGNHEDALHQWATGQEVGSTEFTERTLPQILAAGVTPKAVDTLCDALVDVTRYRFHDHRVLVTHAGLSTVPPRPALVSSRQYAKGTGHFGDPVDARFDRHAPDGWVQVHGHRNSHDRPIQASERSLNLEGAIELGGSLRAAVLRPEGWSTREVRNRVFKPLHQRIGDPWMPFEHLLPPWFDGDLPDAPRLSEEDLRGLLDHPLVHAKPSASRPHLVALNFSRDAFIRREWDELTLRARGLFVDAETREIAARSYDKFFNLGERPETRPEALEQSLRFPVHVYVKENGYLGILGWDAREDELLWASKSTPDSNFARWFRELGEAALPEGRRDLLGRYLRDVQATAVFEVIDPVRDPHIIAYDEPHLVLLDVVRRHRDIQRLPYAQLQRLGERLGLRVKERAMTFRDWRGLAGWLEACTRPGWTFRGREVEGFVLEDAAGFLTKLKLDTYNLWKRMRSLKERVRRVRGTGRPLERDLSDPRVAEFHAWLMEQPDAVLDEDIVALRGRYERGERPTVAWSPPQEAVVDRDLAAIRAMVRSLAAKGPAYELSPRTADTLLRKALANDAASAELRGTELATRAVRASTPGEDRNTAAELLGVDIA